MEEFKQLTGFTNSPDDMMAIKWNDWQPRILAYSKLLKKSSLRDLMDKVQQNIPNGTYIAACIVYIANCYYLHKHLQNASEH